MILKDCKRRLTSLEIAWINYRKDYNMVPQSWIRKDIEVFGVTINVRSFVNASMKQWKTELTAGNQRLGNVKIMRGIFQGDNKSPLLIAVNIGVKVDKGILRSKEARWEN